MALAPFFAKVNPLKIKNIPYWIFIGALPRLITGGVRVYKNRPAANPDQALSQNEKRQACLERFFVEIIGTAGYVASLHLGQDVFSRMLEPKFLKGKIPTIDMERATTIAQELEVLDGVHMTPQEVKTVIEGTLEKVYGKSHQNLIVKVADGAGLRKIYEGLTAQFSEQFAPQAKQMSAKVMGNLDPELKHFSRLTKYTAAGSIIGGVALSALFGGLVTQWLNDRIFAPQVRNLLNRYCKDPIKPLSTPAVNAAPPAFAALPTRREFVDNAAGVYADAKPIAMPLPVQQAPTVEARRPAVPYTTAAAIAPALSAGLMMGGWS